MSAAPSKLIQEAFVAPTAEIVRRVEIFNFDGKTPWRPEIWPRILVGGTVSADMTRGERRNIDCELDNSDRSLSPKTGGLWYDKVIKAYYGIRLHQRDRDPKVAIVEEYDSPGEGLALKSALAQAGVKVVFYNPIAETLDDVQNYDILISISKNYTRKLALLTAAFSAGKSIFTFGTDATAAQLPLMIAGGATSLSTDASLREFDKTGTTDRAMNGWAGEWALTGPHSYRQIIAPAGGTITIAETYDPTNGSSPGVLMRENGLAGSVWIHMQQNKFHPTTFDEGFPDFLAFLRAMIDRLDTYVPATIWETQIGEFVPDEISDTDDFSDRIKLTGRDYAKRCMLSKLTKATSFAATMPIEDAIRALAQNSLITKIDLPITGKTLGKIMTWERDTTRWDIMDEIATSFNYELYFSANGFLTMRPQQDPLLTPPTLVLKTGIGGNLVKRGAKTGDAQLFNHVTVIGESSDTSIPLVFAEALNNAPGSPSRIGGDAEGGIGERTKNFSSPLVTSETQAKALAQTMLSVSALEEFELNFEVVLFPWIEPGEIVEMDDPDGTYWGPTRYLISTLTLPMDLSPMSGTGKRVTKVS